MVMMSAIRLKGILKWSNIPKNITPPNVPNVPGPLGAYPKPRTVAMAL